jgi:capsular polysaccharide biosynthesis protein
MNNMIPNAMTWVTLGNSNAALPTWLRIALIAFTAGMVGFLVYIVIKEMLGR